jgi:hypothetical protein
MFAEWIQRFEELLKFGKSLFDLPPILTNFILQLAGHATANENISHDRRQFTGQFPPDIHSQ